MPRRAPFVTLPPTWTIGVIAAAAWLATAAITAFIPDIDDFERTALLTDIMAALGIILAVLVITTRALGIAPPERIRRTGPWLILLALVFSVWELVPPNPRFCPAPSSPHHKHCWRCSPTTIRNSAIASGIR